MPNCTANFDKKKDGHVSGILPYKTTFKKPHYTIYSKLSTFLQNVFGELETSSFRLYTLFIIVSGYPFLKNKSRRLSILSRDLS